MSSSSPHTRELARRLLSGRNGPSRPDKEFILDRVLARTSPSRRRVQWFGAFTAATLGLAGVALLLRPAAPTSRSAGFVARGGSEATPVLRLLCATEPGAPCRAGDRLRFELVGEPPARYLAAFSRRADGAVIWYFPSDPSASSVDLARESIDHLVGRQVVLGAAHPPGHYEVTALFSVHPLNRDQIRHGLAAELPADITVRRLELVIR